MVSTSKFLQAEYANYLIFGAACLSLLYAFYCFHVINSIEMKKEVVKVQKMDDREKD